MSVLEMVKSKLRRRPPKQLDMEEYIQKLRDRGLTPGGELIPDPVPIAPPIGYVKHPSMVEIVRDMVRSEKLKQLAEEAGAETFEESEDFDIPDDPVQMESPYENEFDPPVEELLQAGREAIAAREAAAKKEKGEEVDEKASGAAPAPKPGRGPEGRSKASGERSTPIPPMAEENDD